MTQELLFSMRKAILNKKLPSLVVTSTCAKGVVFIINFPQTGERLAFSPLLAGVLQLLALSSFGTVIPLSVLANCSTMLEKLCLQWNDFKENAKSTFGILREDNDFADVTLACEDGNQFEAHKVILASSSLFFQNLMRRNKHAH